MYLELPADVLDDALRRRYRRSSTRRPSAIGRRPSPPTDVERAASLLAGAARPLLVAGGGVVLGDAVGELRRLAARLGAAATATQMGLGTVSSADPAFFGHGGLIGGEPVLRALREADVVLLAGCSRVVVALGGKRARARRPAQPAGDPPRRRAVRGCRACCADGTLVLTGDVRDGLASLLVALGDGAREGGPAWLDSLVAAHKAHLARLFEGADDTESTPMHPATLARELADWLPDDALVVYDGGHTTFWSNDLTPALEPRTRFHDPGMAHLGFGLPYALALQVAHPGRAVVNVTGDGAFGFTLAELDTARRHGLPVVTVIHDNAAWGVIRFGQARAGFELDTALEGADYAAVARAFGCHGETVTDAAEIRPALDRALASGLPAVVDVQTRFVPHPSLPRFAAMGRL